MRARAQGLGAFGLFPECFVNNISKRSRSSYLTESKTHQLTNAEFDLIVSRPCHYCGAHFLSATMQIAQTAQSIGARRVDLGSRALFADTRGSGVLDDETWRGARGGLTFVCGSYY
eukprot:1184009-Prorocentrum_minimum.AAC.1